MKLRLTGSRPGDRLKVMAVLAAFIGLGTAWYGWWWSGPNVGDDLSASYLGCRLVAHGNSDHLYSYDPVEFSDVGSDAAWKSEAAQGDFRGYLHPYVQTPLWAYVLVPLCTRLSFTVFDRVFMVLAMLCFAGVLWLVAAQWTPDLINPYAMSLIVTALWFSEPFRYAMFLTQTHIIFFFLALGALALAERGRPFSAGLMMACAAAVKVTPAFLVLYWLITRRWKAAASMVVFSGLLWATAWLIAGQNLMATYIADLDRIAHTLLLAQNNQSFAAWSMGRFYSFDETSDNQIFALPVVVRLASLALLAGITVAGGWLDRESEDTTPVPLGAMMALVAATIFSPIAWTHYFIVLLAPLMLLAQHNLVLRSRRLAAVMVVIVVFNLQPVAWDVRTGDYYRLSLVHSEFYSGLLCLGCLTAAALIRRRRATIRVTAKEPGSRVHTVAA